MPCFPEACIDYLLCVSEVEGVQSLDLERQVRLSGIWKLLLYIISWWVSLLWWTTHFVQSSPHGWGCPKSLIVLLSSRLYPVNVHLFGVHSPETRWTLWLGPCHVDQSKRVSPHVLQARFMFVRPRTFVCSHETWLTPIKFAVHLKALHNFLKELWTGFPYPYLYWIGSNFFRHFPHCQDQNSSLSSGSSSQLHSSCVFYKHAIYLMAQVVRENFEEIWTHNKHSTALLG